MSSFAFHRKRATVSKRKSLQSSLSSGKGPLGGRFYFMTLVYGMWFLVGGLVGFFRKGSFICLGVSCGVGVLLLLLGFAHLIEYNRGIPIESIYVFIPFIISFVLGVKGSVIYGISGGHLSFVPFGMIGVVGFTASAIYLYLFIRDFARNENFVSHNTYTYAPMHGNGRPVPQSGSSYDPFLRGSRDSPFDS